MLTYLRANTSPGNQDVSLNNWQEQPIATMQLDQSAPSVLAVGKVVITNFDGSPQNATVRMTHAGNSVDIDRVDIRVEGAAAQVNASQVVTLIGWITPPNLEVGAFLELRAATWNGVAHNARLMVIGADAIG